MRPIAAALLLTITTPVLGLASDLFTRVHGPAFAFNFTAENSRCLDGDWQFNVDPSYQGPIWDCDHDGATPPAPDAPGWQTTGVPHDAEALQRDQFAQHRPDQGTFMGWYRTTFEIPDGWGQDRIFIYFTGVSYKSEFWVNGEHAARHEGMYDAFQIEVTKYLRPGTNELAVSAVYPLGRKDYEYLGAQDVGHSRPGAGIWGSVHLVRTSQKYVKSCLVTPDLDEQHIKAHITWGGSAPGRFRWQASIVDPLTGETIATSGYRRYGDGTGEIHETLTMSAGDLEEWNLQNPKLYDLVLTTFVQEKPHFEQAFRFGFRRFFTKDRRFYLNREPIYPKAMLMWSGHTNRGRDDKESRRMSTNFVERFKHKNLNIVRTAHSPPSPNFLKVADELGFLVYLEIGNCVHDLEHIDSVREDLGRLAYQYYNHPSVVAYSLGNEVWKTKFVEAQDVLYKTLKAIDRTRPICAVSGGHTWPGNPAKPYGHTDFYDVHNYSGHMDRPWNLHEQSVREMNAGVLKEHYGKIDKPLFLGETIGMSWPVAPADLRSDEQITPARYLKLQQSGMAPMWTTQVGTWRYFWSQGRVGGPGEANRKINGGIVKLVAEQMREIPEIVQGYCAWADNYDPWVEEIIFADVLASCWDIQRHVYAGSALAADIKISNGTGKTFAGALIATLSNEDDEAIVRQELPIVATDAIAKSSVALSVDVPSDAAAGFYRLILRVADDEAATVSENFYPIYVARRDDLAVGAETIGRKIYLMHDAQGRYAGILDKLGIDYDIVAGKLPPAGSAAIMSFAGEKTTAALPSDEELHAWVEAGGRLLVDRLGRGATVPGLEGFRCIKARPMPSVEVVAPTSACFAGLDEGNFFYWDGPFGQMVSDSVFPLSVNALAAKGFDQNPSMAVSAFRIGSGGILVNQLWSAESIENPSAALYTLNLLRHISTSDAFVDAEEPRGALAAADFEVDPTKVTYINLQRAANMAFTDQVADDKKGGWTDQGAVNLGMIEPGVQTMKGVPFMIADEKGGAENTAVLLYSSTRPYFPIQSESVSVGKKLSSLYFLHTSAWCNRQYVGGRNIAYYVINYEDGLSVEIPIMAFRDIAEWWNCADLENAVAAWSAPHPTIGEMTVGLYAMKWDNPKPDKMIMSMSFRSARSSAVPIIVAVTGVAP